MKLREHYWITIVLGTKQSGLSIKKIKERVQISAICALERRTANQPPPAISRSDYFVAVAVVVVNVIIIITSVFYFTFRFLQKLNSK